MKSGLHTEFSRRSLMKAAGSTLAVPFFLKNAFAQTAAVNPNLVMLMQTNGQNQTGFWPASTAAWDSPILNKLLTDPVVGRKATVIKGVNLQKMGNPAGNGHDWGWHGLYSGYDNVGQSGGGPSVDQTLIKKVAFTTPFKNIHCGVHAVDYRLINPGRISFSCESAGRLVPCELNLYSLYTKVFGAIPAAGTTGTPTAATDAAMRRLAQRRSVMDAVAVDLTTLQGRVGASERAKIDVHLTAVRDFEKRLAATVTPATGGAVRPASCSTVAPSKTGVPTTGQNNEANADTLNRLFMEFIANAIGCNMVGVLSFQWGRGGEHFHYKWLNIPGMRADFHDEIAHKDNGSDAVAASVMVEVGKYYTELVTDLAKRLAAFPQANAKTALDNSLVVWGNELATGPHGINGIPIVLLGGAAGKLKTTGYLVNAGTQPHHRLGCTIHNIMGDPVKGFGSSPDCGVFTGLDLA